jgi:hypothetical protein
MMDREQYLLSKAAEEGNEVGQRALKAQQFGLNQTQSGRDEHSNPYGTNAERLIEEFYDLISVMHRLRVEGFIEWDMPEWANQHHTKSARSNRGLELSRSLGKTCSADSV